MTVHRERLVTTAGPWPGMQRPSEWLDGDVGTWSGGAARKHDGPRDILVRPDDQFGLNREPRFTQPTRDLARPTMVTVHADGTPRVALRRVSRLFTDMETDQQRST